MNRISNLVKYYNDLPEVKRIKELESYIDNNYKINKAFQELKNIQKQMVNSKEYNQMNQYKELTALYEKKRSELLDIPFVEEYLELLEIVDQMLINDSNEIERKIQIK